MKTQMLFVAVIMLGACTNAAAVNPSSPMTLTGVWGVDEPASPLGDGTRHAPDQASRSESVSNTHTTTTGATVTSTSASGSKTDDVGDGESMRADVEHAALPREINFTPRPINTGDPCGDCARAR